MKQWSMNRTLMNQWSVHWALLNQWSVTWHQAFVTTCLFLALNTISGQSFQRGSSISSANLGGYSKRFNDPLAMGTNPASFGNMPGLSAGVAVERRFMLKELSVYDMAIAYQSATSSFGINLGYAGFAAYNESSASLFYGRSLGKVSIGTRFNYHRLVASAYGDASAWSADIAISWELTDKIIAGVQAINPVPINFGVDKSEQYSSVYKLGLGYEISDKCFLAVEIGKETEKTVNASIFLQYNLVSRIHLRGGVNTDVGQPFAGLGWSFGALRLYVTGRYHPDLGLTPGLMLLFHKSDQESKAGS